MMGSNLGEQEANLAIGGLRLQSAKSAPATIHQCGYPIDEKAFVISPSAFPTATTFNGSFSFAALRRIAVCVRLSFLAMVAISFEASIDDRSSSSSSGVHKKLRGTVISPSAARQAGGWLPVQIFSLFLTGWDYCGRSLWQGLRLCRGCGAPNL